MRIAKTRFFKPSICRIDAIVGWEKQNLLKEQDSIEVTEEEFEKINEKNPRWFTVESEDQIEEIE